MLPLKIRVSSSKIQRKLNVKGRILVNPVRFSPKLRNLGISSRSNNYLTVVRRKPLLNIAGQNHVIKSPLLGRPSGNYSI